MNLCGRIYLADGATGRTARCGKEAGHKDALDHGPGGPETVEYTVETKGGRTTRIEVVANHVEISDGYHTMNELYDHRRALTAVLAASAATAGDSWRSKRHHPDDAPMFEGGYFIVGIELPTGTITYHYELGYWDDFATVPELEHAPKWDGAPPSATVDRLLELVRTMRD
jgi:hypothetical protein